MDTQNAGWRGKFAGLALAVSLFAVLWFAAAALGTKFGLWNWQFGLSVMTVQIGPVLMYVAAGLSVLALIISLISAPRKRAFMIAFGAVLVSSLALGRVAGYKSQEELYPPLFDVQTDWDDPIQPSDALTTQREATGSLNALENDPVIAEAANTRWPGMGGRRVAEVQEQAEFDTATHKSPKETPYPMLNPLVRPYTAEQAYAAALETVTARGWVIILADEEEGRIEAAETSFWYGFHEDIMIRIRTVDEGVRIDIRSASRTGITDLGSNAKRIRDLLNEIESRLAKGI